MARLFQITSYLVNRPSSSQSLQDATYLCNYFFHFSRHFEFGCSVSNSYVISLPSEKVFPLDLLLV